MTTTLRLFREAMEAKGWMRDADGFGHVSDVGMSKDLRHVLSPVQRVYVLERNTHSHDWFPKAVFNVSHIDFETLVFHHNGQGMWRKDEPTEAVDMHRATQLRINQLLQTAYEQACVEANQLWDRYMKVPKDWNGWTTE